MAIATVATSTPSAFRPLSEPHISESVSVAGGPDDVSLIVLMAHSDTMALDHLYRRYRSAAFATAFALVRDPVAAEDIAQDAFIRAWRGASSFQAARGSVRTWLLTIVRNIAFDQLRAGQIARRHQAGQPLHVNVAHVGEDVPATVFLADDARRLHSALATLPPPQREVVALSFLAGLTHGEIAARTGVPLGTVKGRVRLGLRRLRTDLADLSPDCRPTPRLRTP